MFNGYFMKPLTVYVLSRPCASEQMPKQSVNPAIFQQLIFFLIISRNRGFGSLYVYDIMLFFKNDHIVT